MSGFKIAIGGKGGVGKTTICSVWAQLFAQSGFDVLAIDADPDTNLAAAMGVLPEQAPEPLIHMKTLIGERTGTDRNAIGAYFRMNPEVRDLPEKYWLRVNNLKLLVLGGIKKAGAGCACSEGSFLRAMLTHTILHRQEVVLVDLDAGVECMGRSSIEGIDVLVIVVEPGSRSLDTAKNISEMAKSLNISQVAAIANKITDESQIEQIRLQLGNIPLLASIASMPRIQAADMTRTNVFQAEKELVNLLDQGKQNLMSMIASPDLHNQMIAE
ncbi:MAG: ATP-binding protein [Planctomycetota bacterium]|jgi:CO dehydrogenase maturation factor